MATRRLFLSIDVPQALADDIGSVQQPFRGLSGVRPTDPEQSHVTMKFLGDVADRRLDTVESLLYESVAAADVDRFEATIGGIGVFPSYDDISVVWLGVREGATPMERLHETMESRFVEAGFEEEEHDFTPHVTIARVDHAGSKERIQELVRESDPTVGSFVVDELSVKESILTDDGPVYETVDAVSL